MKKPQSKSRREVFRPSLPGIRSVPDPTEIFSTWQWFFLDSVADNLVRYQHGKGEFYPALAERWSIDGDKVSFSLLKELKFSDGTPLTANDVVASFNRVLSLKRSTHFNVWEFLTDLKVINATELSFSYRGNKESLFLFLSSPEASIWSRDDILESDFHPKRFSGFYTVKKTGDDGVALERNTNSPRGKDFKNAPSQVEVIGNLDRWKSLEGIKNGTVDAFIGDYIPYSELCKPHPNVSFLNTIPLVFIYLLKMNDSVANPFNESFLSNVWALQNSDGLLKPAQSILPPGMEGSLTKSETISALQTSLSKNGRAVRIGASSDYFTEDFLKQITVTASGAGIHLQYEMLNRNEFINAIENANASKFDFLLLGYVASDKFPFTQLKLLTGPRNIKISVPDESVSTSDKIDQLKRYQQSFLKSQLIVPLFFVPSVTIYKSDLDIGNQPTTDAELQFWRVNENI